MADSSGQDLRRLEVSSGEAKASRLQLSQTSETRRHKPAEDFLGLKRPQPLGLATLAVASSEEAPRQIKLNLFRQDCSEAQALLRRIPEPLYLAEHNKQGCLDSHLRLSLRVPFLATRPNNKTNQLRYLANLRSQVALDCLEDNKPQLSSHNPSSPPYSVPNSRSNSRASLASSLNNSLSRYITSSKWLSP